MPRCVGQTAQAAASAVGGGGHRAGMHSQCCAWAGSRLWGAWPAILLRIDQVSTDVSQQLRTSRMHTGAMGSGEEGGHVCKPGCSPCHTWPSC
jgi:hypothetical protein